MRFVQRFMILVLVALISTGLACDSSDDGGGGGEATPTAKTYSKADLTGKWTLVEIDQNGFVRTGILGFNNRGQINVWYYIPG